MSLKHIIFSILFVVFSIYVAFLNPHDSTFHLTQNQTFKLPTVILLLAAAFAGVLISVAILWTSNLKNGLSRWRLSLQKSRSEKRQKRVESLYKKSENFFLSGRMDKALSVIDKVLVASPEHVEALGLKGKILFAQGEKVSAEIFQKKALSHDPQNISVLFDLATTYDEAGQYEDKINLLKKIHRDNPKAIQPLIHLRNTYLKKQDWKNVLTVQDKILPLVRDHQEVWSEELKNKSLYFYERGKQQWEQDKRDPAISDFKQAIKAWNKNSDAHLFLGDAYLEMGKQKLAVKIWFTGFEQTRNIACLTRIQKVFLETDDPKNLIEAYQKAIDPKQPQENHKYILLLALLYLEHGQPEKAKSILEENQAEEELLGSLLLALANKPTTNGSTPESNLNLIREAVFQFAH